ncbi:MAG: 1-acyl-sn-glycerol-3-phosphate acyltransferase [Paludibacteraceae bacterium]|nr:1-acyl-sn-glycerol-3-phosphate acyltransferase [Paludibacteraceae bacterium]
MRLLQRTPVIDNIRQAVADHDLHRKVELHDAVLSREEADSLVTGYARNRHRAGYKFKNFWANRLADWFQHKLEKTTAITGLEKVAGIEGGAIVSCNHFSPDDNCTIRMLSDRLHRPKLVAVSQATNFAAKGWQGFLLKYIDAIPLTDNPAYLGGLFEEQLREKLAERRLVLMYSEQEMWFNYRKPRPPKRGLYHFAAKLGVPVISCFVEIREVPGTVRDEFADVHYVLHVLDPIWADPAKSLKENSLWMARRDFEQKQAAYEQAYGRPLTDEFTPHDIAGWHPGRF